MTQLTTSPEVLEQASEVIDQTGRLSMQFARTYRKPLYPDGLAESDSEHTLSLGWMAIELQSRYYPTLDLGRIAVLIFVHDLVEVRCGDTPTLGISKQALEDKRAREARARTELRELFPLASTLLDLEADYDCDRPLAEFSEEDSFVFVLDKIQPSITHRYSNFGMLRSMGIDTGEKLLSSVRETSLRVERHRERVPLLCDLRIYRLQEDARLLDARLLDEQNEQTVLNG